ncbi:MAG: GNAT family N-acetyltransferase [Vulcanimicrobiota bacterium]
MKIRPITPADSAEAVTLIRSTLEGSDQEHYPTATLEYLIEFFRSDETLQHVGERYCLVAAQEGRLVGAVALDGMEIVTFIVHPQYTGQGIGQSLLEAIEGEARILHLDRLLLSTGPAMVEFFHKRGYRKSGRLISARGVQIGLEKLLTSSS